MKFSHFLSPNFQSVSPNAMLPPSLDCSQLKHSMGYFSLIFICRWFAVYLAVFTCENSVWHHLSLPVREILPRSDDGSLLIDRLQGCAEWKLQVSLFKTEKAIPWHISHKRLSYSCTVWFYNCCHDSSNSWFSLTFQFKVPIQFN